MKIKDRCIWCFKKCVDSPGELLIPWKGRYIYEGNELAVCSISHLKHAHKYLNFFEKYWQQAYLSALWGTVLYFVIYYFFPQYKKGIFLVFTLDWGAGLCIYPCLTVNPGKWWGLRFNIFFVRVISVLIVLTGVIKFFG